MLRFTRTHVVAAATHGQFKLVPELIRHIPDSWVLLYEKCPTIRNVPDTSAFEKKSAVESGLPDYWVILDCITFLTYRNLYLLLQDLCSFITNTNPILQASNPSLAFSEKTEDCWVV